MEFNIYDFIKNDDLVAKCKELNWEFSDYEKAKIIMGSKNSLRQKKDAYLYLLKNTENERLKVELQKIVEYQDKAQEEIKVAKKNIIYMLYMKNEDPIVFDKFELAFDYATDKLYGKNKTFKIKKAHKNPEVGTIPVDEDYVIYNAVGEPIDFQYYANDDYIKSYEINVKTFDGFDVYVPFWNGYVKYPNVYDDFTVLKRKGIDPEYMDDTQYIACNSVAFNSNNEVGISNSDEMPYDIFAGQLCYKYVSVSKRKHAVEVETIPYEGLRKAKKDEISLSTKDTIKRIKEIIKKVNN
jgi:hypothetical protein